MESTDLELGNIQRKNTMSDFPSERKTSMSDFPSERKMTRNDFKPPPLAQGVFLKKPEKEETPLAITPSISGVDENYFFLKHPGLDLHDPNPEPLDEYSERFQTFSTETRFLFSRQKSLLHHQTALDNQVQIEVRFEEHWFSWFQEAIKAPALTQMINKLGSNGINLITKKFEIHLKGRNFFLHQINWRYYNGLAEFLFFGVLWLLGFILLIANNTGLAFFIICLFGAIRGLYAEYYCRLIIREVKDKFLREDTREEEDKKALNASEGYLSYLFPLDSKKNFGIKAILYYTVDKAISQNEQTTSKSFIVSGTTKHGLMVELEYFPLYKNLVYLQVIGLALSLLGIIVSWILS